MPNYTPMMEQYLSIKQNYKEHLLLFRLGDFYELFFDDALIAVDVLDIALTKKSCGKHDGNPIKVDMCGVPFHSVDGYIAKLVESGHTVAICEQTEDAKNSNGKLVKRDVVRVITAGTIIDTNMLECSRNNYIICIFENKSGIALSVCDVSTGELLTISFSLDNSQKVIDELAKYNPSEIICNETLSIIKQISDIFNITPYVCLDFYFQTETATHTLLSQFNIFGLNCFGIEDDPLLISTNGALIRYLLDMQKTDLSHISTIKKYSSNKFMALDISSRRNLELTENIREKSKKGSLLWVLDKTKTPMGARLIRKWIEQPLIDKICIEKRLNTVNKIKSNPILKEDLTENLAKIKDIERLITKISYNTANARDLISLKTSFAPLPLVKSNIKDINSELMIDIYSAFDDLSDLYNLIDKSISDEPPFSIREGGMIKDGFNNKIDLYRTAKKDGDNWLLDLENREKELTGIKNLKIRYNKIFGYYIEITNSQLSFVPDRFVRRQTLANCERYITDELKSIETTLLDASEKVAESEFDIFCSIKDEIAKNIARVQLSANAIATLDVLVSFATVAQKNNYKMPIISISDEININLGRHPVVELLTKDCFIPNNTILDQDENRLAIITGPNMAGKSTYMRQVALIVLMAQIGSFVPCDSATISIVDRIFTRVGASDDLATGQSTFMVEMNEVANILHNATSKSLLILDEIGRGTSTFDGLSIAWAVLEYIADKSLGAKTLFATHYHEITELEGKIQGVTNYHVEIKDNDNSIVFLRKVSVGRATSSYGIHVAELAGIPSKVISRANEILSILTNMDSEKFRNIGTPSTVSTDDDFLYTATPNKNVLFVDELERELKSLDMNNVTPIDALKHLFSIKSKLEKL